MGYAIIMSSLFYQLQACSATANSIHLIASNLTGHAGWSKHQDQGLWCMSFLVKDIQKLKYFSATYCESDFFNGARYVTMGLETRRLKGMQLIVIEIEPVTGNLLKFVQCKCKLSMENPCGIS